MNPLILNQLKGISPDESKLIFSAWSIFNQIPHGSFKDLIQIDVAKGGKKTNILDQPGFLNKLN